MAKRGRRYAYGPYTDGPDPLAPPVDIRAALDEIGRDVMEGSSPRTALQELLRRGMGERRGLDDLTREIWRRRSRLQRENRLDGTLEEVRELLQRAMEAERDTLARDDGDDARFREMQLDALPQDTGGAVRELAEYDWRSTDAREAYEQIRDLLGREMLDQRFQGMKQAMENASPQDVERIREMLDDLNNLIANHAAGQDTTAQFDQFMAQHGEFFPENPQNTEELIDLLAARAAAAQRMLNSMSEAQRNELMELAQQAFGDPRLSEALARIDAQLQGLRPGEDWQGQGRFRGENPMSTGEATRAMEELGQLDALAEQLAQSYPGARLEDIDLDALERHLGDEARVDARALSELQRELERQGLFERAPDGSLALSPKALRRLGESALRAIVDRLGARRGERETLRSGTAGDATGSTRPWAFGDTEAWSVPRTLLNAQLRRAAGDERLLDVTDVEIVETEQRTRAAVALCVDTSWSMVQDGRWVPMKRTALALHQLISTRFRGDDLKLITFGRHARQVDLGELIGLEAVWEQGTNLHHALTLAGQHLRRNPDARPVGSFHLVWSHANLGPGRRPRARGQRAAAAPARHRHGAGPPDRPGRHGHDVRLRHHPLRRHPPRPRRHLPGVRPRQPGVAGSRARRALRAERHRHRRPPAGAGGPRPGRLGGPRHARDRALPRGHGGAAGAPAAALHRRGRGDGGDRRAGGQAGRAGRGLPRRRPGAPRRLLRRRVHRPVRLRVGLRRSHDAGLRPRARRRPRPARQALPARPAPVAHGARGRAVVGVRPRRGQAGLARRVRGDRAQPARHADRPERRRLRPDLPAPRVRRRARRGVHRRAPLRPPLHPHRDDRPRRREDVQVARQPGVRLEAARAGRRPERDPARAPGRALPQRPRVDRRAAHRRAGAARPVARGRGAG